MRAQVDRSEHIPDEHVDAEYFSEEMDFDCTRRDERMANDPLLEWDRYCQQHDSSTSDSSSTNSRRHLIFEQWFRQRQQAVRADRQPSEYLHSEDDTSDSGCRLERESGRKMVSICADMILHGTIREIVSRPANSEASRRGEIRIGNRDEEGTGLQMANDQMILTLPIFEEAPRTRTAVDQTPNIPRR